MHILLSRTAQISLELHFCVEMHTKKSPAVGALHNCPATQGVRTQGTTETTQAVRLPADDSHVVNVNHFLSLIIILSCQT